MRLRLLLVTIFACQLAMAQTATEFYEKGNALRKEEKSSEALAAYKEATNLKPDYAAAWYEMGWCNNDLGNYASALSCLRKARVGWNSIAKVHFELGYAFLKLNMYDSSTQSLNRCLEINPDYSTAHKELGNIAYHKDNYELALEKYGKFEQLTKRSITDYIYWYRKGFMLNTQKKYADAIVALDSSKRLKEGYINTHLEMGFAASRLKQSDAAIAHYRRASEIDPTSYIPYNGIGEVYRDFIKNREEAMTYYKKALELKPNERKACFGMGYCLNSLGKYEQAVSYLKTAIEKESDYTAAYVELGYSYYMLKNYLLGLDNLNKAISLNVANTNARYYAGLIYIAQNNRSMAQKMVDELKGLSSKDAPALQEKVNRM